MYYYYYYVYDYDVLYYESVPFLLIIIRHAGNTSTAVIRLPHMGNKDSDLLVPVWKSQQCRLVYGAPDGLRK